MENELDFEAPVNMPTPPPSVHPFDAWAWPLLIERLREQGYIIVKLPELIGKGKPKLRPYV